MQNPVDIYPADFILAVLAKYPDVTYLAMDENGDTWGYANPPKLGYREFLPVGRGVKHLSTLRSDNVRPNHEWRKTVCKIQ